MALADTGNAIGAVTKLIRERLRNKTGIEVTVSRPEPPANNSSGPRLNLFLYEAAFDGSLKNFPLGEGQPTPLWLILKYLLTAFDEGGETDTPEAHENLGKGLRALQELSILHITTSIPLAVKQALKDNPEELKITFDETPSDLLSKIMQGSDEKYRFSMGFQVRPVMIASLEPADYSLLVGVNYMSTPISIIGEKGIKVVALAALGPQIHSVSPESFEVGQEITILGSDFNPDILSVTINGEAIKVNVKKSDKVVCEVEKTPGIPDLSAGSHSLNVSHMIAPNRVRSSNPVIVRLLPWIDENQITLSAPANANEYGTLTIKGELLGGENDDIILALYEEEKGVVKMYDDITGQANQKELKITILKSHAAAGIYRIILVVNGQQSRLSPKVTLL